MNKPQYKVRQAKLNDVLYFYDAVCSILNTKQDVLEFQINFKEKLKAKDFLVLVAELDNKTVVGCIVAQKRNTLSNPDFFIEIQELYITPKFRKLGAADFLLSAFEALSVDKHISKLTVNCNINSTLTQNFFTKRGFKIARKQYNKQIS
jgi:N-acetylglutamate synthase-like GNAT family acetyltransferase